MSNSSDMENLRTFADQLWKYMVPKINAKLSSNVSYFRAEVVSNPGNNKLEVQRPVENGTLTLPCVRAMSGAQAGQQVVALVMGSMSNAIIVGDGKLNVPVGGGDAGIANFQAQPDGSLVITLTNGVTFTATPIMDDVPTRGSNLAVKSGGIYTALNGKVDNAFANVQVGSTTIAADNNADTLTLVGDGLATLTGNATNDSVTIYVDPNHTHITTQVLDLVNADSYGPSDLVTFDADVSEVPLKNCVVNINPAQAGSGEPSPTNVRPISGWTGANVTRAGKNLLNFTGYNIIKSEYGITFDIVTNENGDLVKIVANGTDTSTSPRFSQVYITVPSSYARNLSGKIVTGGATNFFIQIENAYSPYTAFAKDSGSGATISSGITEVNRANIICRVPRGATVSNLEIFPMIRDAGTDETFEPYQGNTINISFPAEAGTVYGGTLDVLKGTLTVTHLMREVTGATSIGKENPAAWNNKNVYYITNSDSDKAWFDTGTGKGDAVCNQAVMVSRSELQNTSRTDVFGFVTQGKYAEWSSVVDNIADERARLAENPMVFVWRLNVPRTYQLTPELVATLAGQNHIWADCGTISIDYGAFLSALDKAIKEHSDDDIRHITEAERETWDSKADSPHTHDASDIVSGILPAARGGTQNGNGYIQIGQKSGTTVGFCSTAEGLQTQPLGLYCHAEGYATTAGTTASNSAYAHSEGQNTIASGNASHSEGSYTTSSGGSSHAEGSNTVASGRYSHSEGWYTTANHRSQHVFGEYNTADNSSAEEFGRGNYVEIVGNGASKNARSNARTLDWSGNEWIAGTLTQASDARLKDVQGEIPDLSSIRAVRFRWKNGDDKEHLGYLAQDVEGIAPYLVGVDSNGYKSLDYIALLTAKVEMLEREVMELKGDARD